MTPDEIYMEFGKLVREHREALGVKQGALAEFLGLSRTSITNIERGRQRILLHQLFSVAAALGVTVDVLLPRRQPSSARVPIDTDLTKNLNLAEREWVDGVVGGISAMERRPSASHVKRSHRKHRQQAT